MIQRGRATGLDERVAIGERADTGQTDAEIAAAMGRSIWTVRKWRRKHQRQGHLGLASPMGRPPTGALGQCSAEMRDTVHQMREQHSGWGAMTIRVELGNDERFKGLHLPSRSRIAAYLHQEGLTRTPQGQFSLGCRRYNVGVEFENQMLEITFDPQTCEPVCLTEDGRREIRLAAQGLVKSDLMGELHRLTTQVPLSTGIAILPNGMPPDDPFRFLERALTGTTL
jgi:transposase